MVPVRARVDRREHVIERRAGLHQILRVLGAVHRVGHTDAVPVDRRRFGELVAEVDDHLIALVHVEQRAGNRRSRSGDRAVAIRPDLGRRAGDVLEPAHGRDELDLDDRGIGIGVDKRGERERIIGRFEVVTARRCKHEREPSPPHPVKHTQGKLDQRGVVRYAFTKSNGGGVRRNRLAQLVRPMTPTEHWASRSRST